jgi:hypothetical protein
MKTKATTWAAQIVAVLLMLAAGTASASSGLLVENSPLGKISLEGRFRQGLASVSAETCRGCGEFCRFDAAGLFVAPASTSSVIARYGSAEQRQFLLNAVSETGSLREAMGVVHSFREMRRLGYQLENVSLHYRGPQGLDLIFSRGGTFAVVEAKAGGSLSSLRTYAGGLRQGSNGYNTSRLQRYLDFGDGTHDAFVNHLLSEAAAGRLESFAAFYRSGTIYELPLSWPTVPAIPR